MPLTASRCSEAVVVVMYTTESPYEPKSDVNMCTDQARLVTTAFYGHNDYNGYILKPF